MKTYTKGLTTNKEAKDIVKSILKKFNNNGTYLVIDKETLKIIKKKSKGF